jgi:chromosome segregation ATPase
MVRRDSRRRREYWSRREAHLDFNERLSELIAGHYRPRRGGSGQQERLDPDFAAAPGESVEDRTAAALDLVAQAAGAVRDLEARAESLATQALEKLSAAEAELERSESQRRSAEAKVSGLAEALGEAREDLRDSRQRLAAAEAEITRLKERLAEAERRADDAEIAFERIVEAVRTQLGVGGADPFRFDHG